MKKLKVFSAVFFSLLFAVTIAAACFLSAFSNNKNENRFRDFYLIPENTLDVVFIGSSAIHTSVYPTVAYQNSGITSYSLSSDKFSYISVLPTVKEVLRCQDPQLLVIDMDEFAQPQDYMEDEWPIIYWLDSYPFGREKLRLIREYIPLSQSLPYCFPFIRNHSVFTNPGETKALFGAAARYYFKKDTSVVLKGAELGNGVEKKNLRLLDMNTDHRTMPICSNSEKALNELLDYCAAQNVNVLFYDFPRAENTGENAEEFYQRSLMMNEVQALIEKRGFPVVNYNLLHNPADLVPDDFLYDNTHLNIDGSEKFTRYLASYLTETYSIRPDHSAACDAQWRQDADKAQELIESLRTDRENTRRINENDLH